jgi:hypothetical protein
MGPAHGAAWDHMGRMGIDLMDPSTGPSVVSHAELVPAGRS